MKASVSFFAVSDLAANSRFAVVNHVTGLATIETEVSSSDKIDPFLEKLSQRRRLSQMMVHVIKRESDGSVFFSCFLTEIVIDLARKFSRSLCFVVSGISSQALAYIVTPSEKTRKEALFGKLVTLY